MADDTQNYSMFSSRLLVDTVGDVTDEALKASRLKDVIGVLAGRIFNWGQRKSLFPLQINDLPTDSGLPDNEVNLLF